MVPEVSYNALIVEALGRYPEREAFVIGRRRITYAESAAAVSSFVAMFEQRGVRQGNSVALLSPNSPESWFVQAATCLLGGQFTGLQLLGSVDDHAYICDDADVTVLVAAEKYQEHAREVLERSATIEHLILVGDQGAADDMEHVGLGRTLDAGPAVGGDVAWLMYTGGTTGRPKGVMVPQRALVQQTLSHLASWGIPEQPRYLAAGPITHAAVLPILPTLLRGGTVVLMSAFDPEHWVRLVQDEQINLGFLVPTMLYSILDHASVETANLSSLETVTYGAAPTSPARLIEAIDRVGPVFQQVYGQTEIIAVGTSLRRDEHDPSRPDLLTGCGRAVVGAQVAVLGEQGDALPAGEIGELCVRTRAMMLGYRNRPEETAAAIRDGWVRTGDMAHQDDRGFFYLVDRKKDMIISGGHNIYSREVEDALADHPAVADAAVIGIPHEKWGEAVCAVVVRRPDHAVNEAELTSFVRDRKGSLYAPKMISFVEALPVTTTGKVDKKVLRAPYWSDLERSIN
jgi:fatty-acyl-CoA synthase